MTNPVRILVVEDDPDILSGTARLLEKAGYVVDCASSGEDALSIIQRQRPDLLLLDRDLPGINGVEVCLRLKRDKGAAEIFVAMLSASYTESDQQAEGLEAGADGYITRPITNRELLARIESYVRILRLNRSLRSQTDELHKVNAVLQAAMDQSSAGIAIADAPDGKLRYVNDAGLLIRGGTRESVVNGVGVDQYVASWQLMDLDGRPLKADEVPLARAILFGETSSREFIIRKAAGDDRIVIGNAAPIRDEDGKVVAGIVVFTDITERKRAEEDLERSEREVRSLAESELQKTDKLQSIGKLAGGIAHDFNNILQGLFGNISFAKEDLPKDHPAYESLKEAEKSMSRAVRLTKQLLTFAKGGAPVKENVELGALVEETVRFDLSGSNVSLVYRQAEALWPVNADREQIQQVFSNLVLNARQAMPNGGPLTVTLENASLPAEAVPGLRAGSYVKIMVRDEGCGIEPKDIAQIFDPYFSTRPTGSGLGLTTVWSIINKHGGHIGVVSDLGKGTTFTFYLPAAASTQSAEAKPYAAECLPPASTAKILVMDDEEMVCGLAARMLTRCGYSVTTAPDGQVTIALYRQALEAGAPFDAVIMDLTIPGGPGGKEIIQHLLALDPNVRALVSSGYADDPVMANPAKYGFKGTVAKPYTARALREAVARVLT